MLSAVDVEPGRPVERLQQVPRLNPHFALAHGYYVRARGPSFAISSRIIAYGEFVGRNYQVECTRRARNRQRFGFAAAYPCVLTTAAAGSFVAGENCVCSGLQ